jgi:hypothetical protein
LRFFWISASLSAGSRLGMRGRHRNWKKRSLDTLEGEGRADVSKGGLKPDLVPGLLSGSRPGRRQCLPATVVPWGTPRGPLPVAHWYSWRPLKVQMLKPFSIWWVALTLVAT